MKKHAQHSDLGRISARLRATCRYGLACSLLAMLSAPVFAQGVAQTAPPTRDELTRLQQQNQPGQGMTLTVDGQMERLPCALDDPKNDDLRFTLSQVQFAGGERASDVSLLPAYEGYLGQEIPVRALCDIRDRAAALLNDAGYLAAVEIPPQNLGGGNVELRIVLGKLVAIRARGQTRGEEKLLKSYLSKLVGREVFRVDEAERYLLLASDIPGMDVRLSLRAAEGGAPGDLVGEIAVRRDNAVLDVSVQNLGSRAIGRFGGLVRGEVYGLTGLGDRTSIAAFSTLEFREQQTVQIGHDMLLGDEGFKLGGQLTLGWTNPSALPGFDIESETVFATLEASYPFLRSQTASIWGAGGIDLVDQDVTVNGFDLTRDRVRTAFLKAQFLLMDEDSVARRDDYSPYEPKFRLSGAVELRQGLGIFSATADCRPNLLACTTGSAIPPSRVEQDPTPFFVRGQIATEYRPVPELTLAYALNAQASPSPLPAFEEFSGGNYSIGRGYDPGAVLGDSGVGMGIEARYGSLRPDDEDDIKFQPYLFTDIARGWQDDPSVKPLNPDSLWSAGGGVRFARGGSLQGDLALAIPLRRTNAQTERGDVRVLFTLSARLIPWSFSK